MPTDPTELPLSDEARACIAAHVRDDKRDLSTVEFPSAPSVRGAQVPEAARDRIAAILEQHDQTNAAALATIRELRAEAAREFESGNVWCERALASEAALSVALAERDRARDLATHLEAEAAEHRCDAQ